MMHKRTCPECGAAFTPHYRQQVCCSDECRAVRAKRLRKDSDARQKSKPRSLDSKYFHRRVLSEKKSAARRRAEFFAARDRAFERAGLPIPKIEVRDGVRIERRGYGFGSIY